MIDMTTTNIVNHESQNNIVRNEKRIRFNYEDRTRYSRCYIVRFKDYILILVIR